MALAELGNKHGKRGVTGGLENRLIGEFSTYDKHFEGENVSHKTE